MTAEFLYAVAAVLTAAAALVAAVTGLLNRRAAKAATAAATEAMAAIADVHSAVASPNGQSTGDAVAEIVDSLRGLAKDVAVATAAIGAHVADGHGGHLPL